MWFLLSLLALSMLVSRRTTEKQIVQGIDSMTLGWLQQASAIPFILVSILFARFYLPTEFNAHFWFTMCLFVMLNTIDLFCYFKAISLADISFVAPLISLVAAGSVIGAYIILGQKPSIEGMLGAGFIVAGAFVITKNKNKSANHGDHKKALIYIMILLIERSIITNIEVFMLRESNPTSYNFYSSFFTIWFIIFLSYVLRKKRGKSHKKYWLEVKQNIRKNKLALTIIGLTYMVNMTATYTAKIMAPNAGYVGAVKQAQVVPMVIIGVLFFKEKFSYKQWIGVLLILFGLIALARN